MDCVGSCLYLGIAPVCANYHLLASKKFFFHFEHATGPDEYTRQCVPGSVVGGMLNLGPC